MDRHADRRDRLRKVLRKAKVDGLLGHQLHQCHLSHGLHRRRQLSLAHAQATRSSSAIPATPRNWKRNARSVDVHIRPPGRVDARGGREVVQAGQGLAVGHRRRIDDGRLPRTAGEKARQSRTCRYRGPVEELRMMQRQRRDRRNPLCRDDGRKGVRHGPLPHCGRNKRKKKSAMNWSTRCGCSAAAALAFRRLSPPAIAPALPHYRPARPPNQRLDIRVDRLGCVGPLICKRLDARSHHR